MSIKNQMKWKFIQDSDGKRCIIILIFKDQKPDYLKQMFFLRCSNQQQVEFFSFFSKENYIFPVLVHSISKLLTISFHKL